MVYQVDQKLNMTEIFKLKKKYHYSGYSTPKWVLFCELFLTLNWTVYIYKSRSTVSKYVYIEKSKGKKNHKLIKIRFSNHKPNYKQEVFNGDSDYYVGVFNKGCITTEEVCKEIIDNDRKRYPLQYNKNVETKNYIDNIFLRKD